jgi:hypothetical protein
MSFTHKIVHVNDRDEIWVQNQTNNTLNPESNDPVTAKAVRDAINTVKVYRESSFLDADPNKVHPVEESYFLPDPEFVLDGSVTVCGQAVSINLRIKTLNGFQFSDDRHLALFIPEIPEPQDHYWCPLFSQDGTLQTGIAAIVPSFGRSPPRHVRLQLRDRGTAAAPNTSFYGSISYVGTTGDVAIIPPPLRDW